MMLAKGYNPAEFTVLVYGGAGPVHMWGFTHGLAACDVITVPYAAAFSAFGASCSEYMHRYHRGYMASIADGAPADVKASIGREIEALYHEMEDAARRELAEERADVSAISFKYGIYVRYMGQIESFDTPLAIESAAQARDVDGLIAAFEDMYARTYPEGARFPGAGHIISELYIKAAVPKAMPVIRKHALRGAKPSNSAYIHSRRVCHNGEFHEFKVWQMGELDAGNVVEGPSIIRDPMTTLIIPPDRRVEIDEYMVIHYR
jgi:N-methylhydantoinase A